MRLIDKDRIRWHDINENGLHEDSDMIVFKNEINNIEEVEAIPVKWIETYLEEMNDGQVVQALNGLLGDWNFYCEATHE